MRIRNDVPIRYDTGYALTIEEQTVIIEMSFVNWFILEQVRMPMVKDMRGGSAVVECFQRCLGACILAIAKSGLLTQDFYDAHKDILDSETGIQKNVRLDTMGVSDLSYDVSRMINRYMVVMGHEREIISEQDDLYGNKHFFTPYRG